jgi:hypothetical protein
MRGTDEQTGALFSYLSPDALVPPAHPLRRTRPLVNTALKRLSPKFHAMYASTGPTSIAPEKLLRALLLQAFYESKGRASRLCFMGHLLMENWHGLIVDVRTTHATDRAEREATEAMIGQAACGRRVTPGADKAYDAAEHVARLRAIGVTPHVAQNTPGRCSAIDGRTTRHVGYGISQRLRKRMRPALWHIDAVRAVHPICSAGCRPMHRRWNDGSGSTCGRATGRGVWTKPTSRSEVSGLTCIAPSTAWARRSTFCSRPDGTRRRRSASSARLCANLTR